MTTDITHNAEAKRYELTVDGEFAGFTEAHPMGDDVVLFPHTLIEPAFEGRGLASVLVTGALDDVRDRGLKIKVTCPYILGWLPKHPEYQELVA